MRLTHSLIDPGDLPRQASPGVLMLPATLMHDTNTIGAVPTPTPTSSTSSGLSPDGGLVGRWLLDPGGMQHELLHRLRHELDQGWSTLRPFVIPAGVCIVLAMAIIWRHRAQAWRRARAGARWVEVIPPPATETADGQAMWRALLGLLRPGSLSGRTRLLTWELHAGSERVHAGMWVPASIALADVTDAIRAAYPRARLVISRHPDSGTGAVGLGGDWFLGPDLPSPWPATPSRATRLRERIADLRGRPVPVRRPASVGYLVTPRESMWRPLLREVATGSGRMSPRARAGSAGSGSGAGASRSAGDGLAMLGLGLAETPAGYRAVVRVMARPLPAATQAAARRVKVRRCTAGARLAGPRAPPRAEHCRGGLAGPLGRDPTRAFVRHSPVRNSWRRGRSGG